MFSPEQTEQIHKTDRELGKGWTLIELNRNGKKLMTCRMPKQMVEQLDKLVQEKRFMNRSAAIRYIIQSYLDNMT